MQILIKSIKSVNNSDLQAKPEYLTEERWKKIQSIKIEADQKRSLVSGYLQYQMCKDLNIQNPQYGCTEKGKPYLEGNADISFNISHSGEYVVLAYHENGHPIGIDIQQTRSLHDGMKKRILHEKEQVPEEISKEEETEFLNRIWSIKESYVKMTGDGLAYDFRKILVDIEKGQITAQDKPKAYFVEMNEFAGYYAAICTTEKFGMITKIYP